MVKKRIGGWKYLGTPGDMKKLCEDGTVVKNLYFVIETEGGDRIAFRGKRDYLPFTLSPHMVLQIVWDINTDALEAGW